MAVTIAMVGLWPTTEAGMVAVAAFKTRGSVFVVIIEAVVTVCEAVKLGEGAAGCWA